MALEDFFTSNEINNGLAAPDRVKELVSLMQQGTDCVINNISDARQQWSAVARALACTENKNCLLLFVQLDGLIYMNRWLKDASDFTKKTSDSCVEDTIIDLIRAFSRIGAYSDKLGTSEVWMTVRDLRGHNNPKVRDMAAKSLLEMWAKEEPRESVMKEDFGMTENTKREVSEQNTGENGNLGPSNRDIDASQESLTSEIQKETFKDDLLSAACESLKEDIKKTSLDGAISNGDIPYSTSIKSFPKPMNVNLDKLEPPSYCSEENPSAETCSVVGPKQVIQKEEVDGSEFDPTSTQKLTQKMTSSLQILDNEKDPEATLSTDNTGTLHSVTEPCNIQDDDAEEKGSEYEVSDCPITAASEDDKKLIDDNIMAFRMNDVGKHNSNVLVPSNSSELKPKHLKGSGGLFQRSGNLGILEGHINDKVEDYDFLKKNSRKYHSIEMKSDFDLDYGIADPLEIARLVAIEVEREVEDRMELSCSSSDKEMNSKVQQPDISHSTTGEQCEAESSAAEVSTQPDISLDWPTRDHVISARSLDSGSQEARSCQVTNAAQAVESSTNEGRCHFDLNQDVCLEDVEQQEDTTSTPVSVVSASRAAAPLMHVGPLQFEGALGWKGSAATSAFRPASPRRVPESDFSLSTGGSNSISKENHRLLNIDLNAAESGDDKQVPVSFQLASLESSAETSSRRSEVLEFDLNQMSDDVAPLDLQLEQVLFHQRISHHNESSSSSSSKQPSLRNIDLNDQHKVANDLSSNCFYLKPSQSLPASGSIKSDDSVISIMGMRVQVNRRDSSVKPVPLPNGIVPEHPVVFNLERPGSILAMESQASYPNPHIFGLNGLPPGSSIPFPSPMHGSGGAAPYYIVDSRGSSVIPQILPSPSISTSFPQAPYLFNMPGMPSANGVGSSRDSFDLNSGMYSEGNGRDLGGFRQLFNPPQPRPFDEQSKVNSQPLTSLGIGVGGKRKESENMWESYPFKHHQQPWR